MTSTTTRSAQELLEFRIRTLLADVARVAKAIDKAEERNHDLSEFSDHVHRRSREAADILDDIKKVVEQLEEIVDGDTDIELALASRPARDPHGGSVLERFRYLSEQVASAQRVVRDAGAPLRLRRGRVSLADRTSRLQASLKNRCDKLTTALGELSARTGTDEARTLWRDFEKLLDDQARPLFVEYVEFLGGLTVRETGLDDRICDMSELLLSGVGERAFLSIPASTAALGGAMRSVIKLGFPEWSVWGLPLVAHEAGVAVWTDSEDLYLRREEIRDAVPGDRDEHEVAELFGDAFAAYTMGPAYGCAALLLRLQPHRDEPRRANDARDVERARLILGVLHERAGDPEGGMAAFVRRVTQLWQDATATLAAASGADPGGDAVRDTTAWVDGLRDTALRVLDGSAFSYPPLLVEQWPQVELRREEIGDGRQPTLTAERDALLELLNAAWVARLDARRSPEAIADVVTKAWESKSPGASTLGGSHLSAPRSPR